VHTGFFGPTRDASWADNWDGELDDLLASLQGQVASVNEYRYFINIWYMNAKIFYIDVVKGSQRQR